MEQKTNQSKPEVCMLNQIKIIQNHSDPIMKENLNIPTTQSQVQIIDFDACVTFLNERGKALYGEYFEVDTFDYEIIYKVLVYVLKDANNAERHNIDLNKGLLISGPVGCGKTSLMTLINFIYPPAERYLIKSCREVSYDFISNGYGAIHKYSYQSFIYKGGEKLPRTWCFDDLGTENTLKYYGNNCNVMAEILQSRYDLFIQRDMKTHLTTNLEATEIEEIYGSRVRSRLREMFNLVAFSDGSRDKRR